MNGDLRELRPKACNPAGQQVGRASFHQTDVQVAAQAFHGLELLLGLRRQFQNLACPAQQQPAGIGNGKLALAPDEELDSELFLQTLDLRGKRRLAHVQPFGGAGDVPFLRNRHEIIQRSQIHG